MYPLWQYTGKLASHLKGITREAEDKTQSRYVDQHNRKKIVAQQR